MRFLKFLILTQVVFVGIGSNESKGQVNPDSIIVGRSYQFWEGRPSVVTTEETQLGNVAADAMLWQAKQVNPNVRLAIRHAGSFQTYIGRIDSSGNSGTQYLSTAANPAVGKAEGDISQLDLQNAIPNNSSLTILTVTASQLKAILEYSLAASGTGQQPSRFPQIAGLRFKYDLTKPINNRIVEAVIVDQNPFINLDTLVYKFSLFGDSIRTFRLVTLANLANGGEGFPLNFNGTNRVNLDTVISSQGQFTFANSGTDHDAIAEYLYTNINNGVLGNRTEQSPQNDFNILPVHLNTNVCILGPENPTVSLINGSLCNCNSPSSITFKAESYNAHTYNWIVRSDNGTIISGSNQKQATFQFQANSMLAEVAVLAENGCGFPQYVSGAYPDITIWDGKTWSKGKPDATKDALLAERNSYNRWGPIDSFEVRNLYLSTNFDGFISLGGYVDIYGDVINYNDQINYNSVIRFMGNDTSEIKGKPLYTHGSILIKPNKVLKTNNKLILQGENLYGLAFGNGTPGGGGQVIGNVSFRKQGKNSNLEIEFWSSPITNANTSILGNTDIRRFNAVTQTWDPSGFGQSLPNNTSMEVGRGYTSSNSGVVAFTGTPNNGTIIYPLALNNGVNNDWNLVGNPYPGILDLNAFLDDNVANFNGSIYKWEKPFVQGLNNNNFSGSDYSVYNYLNLVDINTMDAFFVEATSNTLNFNNGQRFHYYHYGLRSSTTPSKIRLALTNNQNQGRTTLIGFTNQASNGYDHGYDAKYLNGYTNLGISSLLNNEKMAIQAFGPLNGSRIVDLDLHSGTTGTHTITIDTLENIDPNTTIYLEDLSSSQFHNLLLSGYTFQVNQAGAISNRFKLHLNSMTTSTPLVERPKPVIFSHEDRLVINGLDTEMSYTVNLFDLSGRMVLNRSVSSNSSKFEYKPAVSQGAYLVQLTSQDGQTYVNQKIVIK